MARRLALCVLGIFLISIGFARPVVLAHYMPWYANKKVSGAWGWHWTMAKHNPDEGKFASKFTPLRGLYDSSDRQVVRAQLAEMKEAGIEGVLVDWYGIDDVYDYAMIHRNTQIVVEETKRAGLSFGVVYEDQTIPNIVKLGKGEVGKEALVAKRTLRWLTRNWFNEPHYIRVEGRPLFLVFGPQCLKTELEWNAAFDGTEPRPYFLTLHHRKFGADGAYDWPLPQEGHDASWKKREEFFRRTLQDPVFMAVAYPRFDDAYALAGLPGYPQIRDDGGATWRRTLADSLNSRAKFVQIATWNDWGEGTQIEPSQQHGNRDLTILKEMLQKVGNQK